MKSNKSSRRGGGSKSAKSDASGKSKLPASVRSWRKIYISNEKPEVIEYEKVHLTEAIAGEEDRHSDSDDTAGSFGSQVTKMSRKMRMI